MNKIVYPLNPKMKGPQVSDLQEALQAHLGKDLLPAGSSSAKNTLAKTLTREREQQTYGKATAKAVSLFQTARHLPASGEVDKATADALNARRTRQRTPSPAPGQHKPSHVTKRPKPGPITKGGQGPIVGGGPLHPGKPKPSHRPDPEDDNYKVLGLVACGVSASVDGLTVVIVDKGVGGDAKLTEAKTNDSGAYRATFSAALVHRRGKVQPDLQAQVMSGKTILGVSEVRYNASTQETLDVLLDASASLALRSEYESLTTALTGQFQGKLGGLKETDKQHDLTFLANKTGWDARAVALAALADQFSALTGGSARARSAATAIPAPFFYALFRAGLPANSETLFRTDAKTVAAIWKEAAARNVIPQSSAEQIPALSARFQAFGAQQLLTGPALIGSSSLNELLSASGLKAADQEKFAQIYAANRNDWTGLWKAVTDSFGQAAAKRLQVDGKLAFLTINNAPLMQKVRTDAGSDGLSDPLQLAAMGLYDARGWLPMLTGNVPVPKEIAGDSAAEKRANYASYLAAQVRLSYPTACVAQMITSGDLALDPSIGGDKRAVAEFLDLNQGKFEVGMQPVRQFTAQNKLPVTPAVKQIERLQRLYQITPSDAAMQVLAKRQVNSAQQIVRQGKQTFIAGFAGDLGGTDQAAQIYERAAQIHGNVLNIVLGYLNARTAPAIGVHSPTGIIDPAPANTGDVIAYATLESLMGSMDFCACDHCRSILSPAAYLVDLLQFLKSDDTDWTAYAATWKTSHGGAPYPYASMAEFTQAGSPAGSEISPFAVLMSRRPDIQHLALTCDNTNTALPYIDLVNETLEYYVTQGSLDDYTGHDTDGVASADLLASPQYVSDTAYGILKGELFPPPLPFHQPLEYLRRYFDKFKVPLPQAMARLRKSDDLERGGNPYGWRDILMEQVGLARAEHGILTDSTAVTLAAMFGFTGGTTAADVVAGLANAKGFAKRMGVSYEDLVALLQTRFINPNSDLIPKLQRLGVSFAALKALKDGTLSDSNFDSHLAGLALPPDPAAYGGDIKAWVKNNANYSRIMDLITLSVPAAPWAAAHAYSIGDCVLPSTPTAGSTLYYVCTVAGTSAAAEPSWPTAPGGDAFADGTSLKWLCRDAASCQSFEDMVFRYSDPDKLAQNLNAADFLRMLRFIRLRKRLGWTIHQTDTTICSLYRADTALPGANDVDTAAKQDTGFLTLLPRLGALMGIMQTLSLSVDRDLLALLACLGPIGTNDGAVWAQDDEGGLQLQLVPSLYRQVFLNPAVQGMDAAYADNGYGEFLADTTQKLADHAAALRSAFNLTAGDYDLIATHLGYTAGTTLSLANISAIFRYGWLAHKLKLSVRELLPLIEFTGLDPWAVAANPDATVLVRLVGLIQTLKDRSLKSGAALYLIWNQDLSGKSAPTDTQVQDLARTLRDDFAGIDAQFSVAEDPNGDVAPSLMSLVYGQETSAAFFGLLDGTIIMDVAYTHSAATLAAAITTADPAIAYDDFSHRLAHTGIMTAAQQIALKAVGGVSAAFKDAVDALYARGQEIKDLFFNAHPELLAPFTAAMGGATLAERHSKFLAAFDPALASQRKRQQALQRLSATAGTDPSSAQMLLDAPAPAPFPLHQRNAPGNPALDDVIALQTAGLAAQFYFRATATGTVDQTDTAVANLNYTAGGDQPFPNAGNPVSGIWSGKLEAPDSGYYNLIIEADAAATLSFTLDGAVQALTRNGGRWRNSAAIQLTPNTLHAVELKAENVKDHLRLQWETPKRPLEVIPARYLYPPSVFDPFHDTYVRFLKATSLATALGIGAAELAFLATQADYRFATDGLAADGWLNRLPVDGDPSNDTAKALCVPFQALLGFARIKSEISPADGSLLTVLKDPTGATADAGSLLFTLTHWDPVSLDALLTWFAGCTFDGVTFSGAAGDLAHFGLFRRVYAALKLAQSMGIPAASLTAAVTNDPTADAVRNLQAALRARYDAASWRDVIRPINDAMRSLQRNALLAHILQRMRSHPESTHIDTPDKLFEFFLMDVQMEPMVQTSRIRHALSSVQLFIQRGLMNLEPRVSPAALDAERWQWMKRYRVWEANRKVFLYPENWLEPELRDDQSPFFKEAMSELLQGDVTEDRAAIALLNYLAKLDEVAKLEPCGIYYLPADQANNKNELAHVVARTAGAQRKYYYRRLDNGAWTPWEQIKLDIEDNPVIPVVWDNRLLLFWLRIIQAVDQDAALQGPSSNQDPLLTDAHVSGAKAAAASQPPKMLVQAVLCWSEHYNGKWQATKTSDVNKPLLLGSYSTTSFDRNSVSLGSDEVGDGQLRISIYTKPAASADSAGTTHAASGHVMEMRASDTGVNYHSWINGGLIGIYTGPDLIWAPQSPKAFVLFNTHSLPVISYDEMQLTARTFNVAGHRCTISYAYPNQGTAITRDVLTGGADNTQVVAPNHALTYPNSWSAPFFYADCRYVFYVTTQTQPVTIIDNHGYGVFDPGVYWHSNIPPLVTRKPWLHIPPHEYWPGHDPMRPGPTPVATGVPSLFVSQDAYINQGFETGIAVSYGDAKIGPAGAFVKNSNRRL